MAPEQAYDQASGGSGPGASQDQGGDRGSLEEELQALFGKGASEVQPRRDYVALATSAFAQLADNFVEQLVPLLPPDLVPHARQHAGTVLLVLFALTSLIVYGLYQVAAAGPKRRSLLLYGPMGAGKTTLFYALQGAQLPHGSTTSMQPNEAAFIITGTKCKVEVVDVPGHPRMRSVFEQWCRTAAGVVFLVDAVDFVRQKSNTAALLYGVLCDLARAPVRVPVVVACNKADGGSRAFSVDFIQKQLEKEIATLRETRGVQLGRDKGAQEDGLTKPGQLFSLAECTVPVKTCSISAKEGDIAPIQDFVRARF